MGNDKKNQKSKGFAVLMLALQIIVILVALLLAVILCKAGLERAGVIRSSAQGEDQAEAQTGMQTEDTELIIKEYDRIVDEYDLENAA